MSSAHQRIKWRRNIAENFNRLSGVRHGPPGRQSYCPEPPSLEDHCKARRYAPVVEHATPTTEWGARTLQADDRRHTDGRTMTYSEHEHEFTFAKNHIVLSL